MKKQAFRRKGLILFFVNVLIVFLACGLMLNQHFSADTFDILFTSDNNVDVHLRDGRFITALLYKLLAADGINAAKSQSLFVFLFMLTAAALAAHLSLSLIHI